MRVGTRGSPLALAQAQLVAQLLGGAELLTIATIGDRESSSPGHGASAGGGSDKSRWVVELEEALAVGEIDLAVHSAKDVPGELADGLALLGAPARAAAEDVLCGSESLDRLAPGSRVGTSSLRRSAQLLAARQDLEIVPLHGNVDTRMSRLQAGDYDAIVLAHAGLQRLKLLHSPGGVLDVKRFVPSPGQGTLALQGRVEDAPTLQAVQGITDSAALACLLAERTLARDLDAGCHTPLGAHAVDAGCGCLLLRAWVGLPDGSEWIADELMGGAGDPEALGRDLAGRLKAVGAGELLQRAEEMAGIEHA